MRQAEIINHEPEFVSGPVVVELGTESDRLDTKEVELRELAVLDVRCA